MITIRENFGAKNVIFWKYNYRGGGQMWSRIEVHIFKLTNCSTKTNTYCTSLDSPFFYSSVPHIPHIIDTPFQSWVHSAKGAWHIFNCLNWVTVLRCHVIIQAYDVHQTSSKFIKIDVISVSVLCDSIVWGKVISCA